MQLNGMNECSAFAMKVLADLRRKLNYCPFHSCAMRQCVSVLHFCKGGVRRFHRKLNMHIHLAVQVGINRELSDEKNKLSRIQSLIISNMTRMQ